MLLNKGTAYNVTVFAQNVQSGRNTLVSQSTFLYHGA